jgi:hypothetical protein
MYDSEVANQSTKIKCENKNIQVPPQGDAGAAPAMRLIRVRARKPSSLFDRLNIGIGTLLVLNAFRGTRIQCACAYVFNTFDTFYCLLNASNYRASSRFPELAIYLFYGYVKR